MATSKIAIYIRLSVEDEKTESLSIPNQRRILREKAMSLAEFANSDIEEFVDNGFTGTNFERPAIQRLIDMVRMGKICTVIVKDLSRFGRTSIETGYFIEKVFPLYHIRFISVSDDFDTNDHIGDNGGIELAFKYLINECYSRDISTKIKSARQARTKRGEYQSERCPYGYQKGEDGRLTPDKDTADNVRMIFEWAADGTPTKEIVKKLHELNIPTPAEHRANKGNKVHDISRTNGVWCISTILRLLADERYTGMYIGGKRYSVEVGSSHVRMKDESEWVKIPDHHEPIISKELYEKANSNITRFSQPNKKPRDYLLRSKVFCGCCDHALGRIGNTRYTCRFSEQLPDFACHSLSIKVSELEQVVFDTIRKQAGSVLGIKSAKSKVDLVSTQQEEHEKKLRLLKDEKRHLYEQYTLGELDIDTYKARKAELDVQIAQEKNVAAVVEAEVKSAQDEYEESVRQKKIADELNDTDTLTKTLVDLLIKRVYVFPDNRIEIEYNTRDFLKG